MLVMTGEKPEDRDTKDFSKDLEFKVRDKPVPAFNSAEGVSIEHEPLSLNLGCKLGLSQLPALSRLSDPGSADVFLAVIIINRHTLASFQRIVYSILGDF